MNLCQLNIIASIISAFGTFTLAIIAFRQLRFINKEISPIPHLVEVKRGMYLLYNNGPSPMFDIHVEFLNKSHSIHQPLFSGRYIYITINSQLFKEHFGNTQKLPANTFVLCLFYKHKFSNRDIHKKYDLALLTNITDFNLDQINNEKLALINIVP